MIVWNILIRGYFLLTAFSELMWCFTHLSRITVFGGIVSCAILLWIAIKIKLTKNENNNLVITLATGFRS